MMKKSMGLMQMRIRQMTDLSQSFETMKMEVAALVRTRVQEEVLIAKQDIEAHWNHIHSCPQAGTRDQGVPSFHEAADVGKSEQKVNNTQRMDDVFKIMSEWQPLPLPQWKRIYGRFSRYVSKSSEDMESLIGQLGDGAEVDHALLVEIVQGARLEDKEKFYKAGRLLDETRKEQWRSKPCHMDINANVFVHYGFARRTGKALRAGFGKYADQYRVLQEDDDKDQWVDMWRCTERIA